MTLEPFPYPILFIVVINSFFDSSHYFYSWEHFPRIQFLLPELLSEHIPGPFSLLWLTPAVSSLAFPVLTSLWTPVLVTWHPLVIFISSLPPPSLQVWKLLIPVIFFFLASTELSSWPVHCRVFSSIPGLGPVEVNTHPPIHSDQTVFSTAKYPHEARGRLGGGFHITWGDD